MEAGNPSSKQNVRFSPSSALQKSDLKQTAKNRPCMFGGRGAFEGWGRSWGRLSKARTVSGDCDDHASRHSKTAVLIWGRDGHHEERAHTIRSRGAHRIGRASYLPERREWLSRRPNYGPWPTRAGHCSKIERRAADHLQHVQTGLRRANRRTHHCPVRTETVPVVANGGIGDTTGTVVPFDEERQEHDSPSNLGHL